MQGVMLLFWSFDFYLCMDACKWILQSYVVFVTEETTVALSSHQFPVTITSWHNACRICDRAQLYNKHYSFADANSERFHKHSSTQNETANMTWWQDKTGKNTVRRFMWKCLTADFHQLDIYWHLWPFGKNYSQPLF